MLAEHRHESLLFEQFHLRIAPGQNSTVRYVYQAHCASRVRLAGCPDTDGAAIRECKLLLVARRAGLLPVHRHSSVIEQVSS